MLSLLAGLAIAAPIGLFYWHTSSQPPCYASISPVAFLPGQVTIGAVGRITLDRLCECLRDNPEQYLTLVGSSDPIEAGSQALAAQRAHAVKMYLVEGSCALNGERLSDQGSVSGGPASGGKVVFTVQK